MAPPFHVETPHPINGTQIRFIKLAALLRTPKYRPRNRRGTNAAIQLNQEALPSEPRIWVTKTIPSVHMRSWWRSVWKSLTPAINSKRITHRKRDEPKTKIPYQWRLVVRS